ncbi:MAG: saccharopine dehydrogenase NADP-binding domain-containing protein [Bacteroidetes bacterium]|nr:saccharopine dehydrogenase NADP-binding domain-containing protein [Bacteroidota bacterium]
MKKVLVLGSGLVGRPIALDLAERGGFRVTVADRSAHALAQIENQEIETLQCDLTDASFLTGLCAEYDMFVNAVPGSIGFGTLKVLACAGKPVVDIAFYADNPRQLDELARQYGSCVICDMGVAPGMSHMLSGLAAARLPHLEKLRILVGGLPARRSLPWQYKAVFSPSDVIEEYTRPARIVRNGKIEVVPALSESELIDFEDIGTLEAFNSDGLRTLADTIKAEHMAEKTLRYPGHLDAVKLLRDSGFFSTEALPLGDQQVTPLQFTSAVLFEQWKLQPGEADLTVMRIEAEGLDSEGHPTKLQWDLLDRFDSASGIHSMARTTGYAATAALRLLASGAFNRAGIHMPEHLGADETLVSFILSDMEKRGIVYKYSENKL